MNASEQLIKAAKSGNVKEVKKLLSKGALFTKDEFGNTALHEACWTGNNDIVKILLKASCFVDSVNGAGFTPLHLASQNGHAKVAKTLLKWKADPTIKNQHEEAAIHLVAKYDHSHVVPVFATAKVDLDIKGKDDNTALHIAAKLGYIATVKALVQSGANPNFTNMKRKLPIDYAEIGDYHDTVKVLIPLTERPAIMGRRATMDSRSKTPETSPIYAKKGSVFSRSPRSFKGSSSSGSPRKKYDSPHTLNGVELRSRDRSVSVTTPPKRRYSREFEDLPPRLYTYSSTPGVDGGRSPLVRSIRSNTRTPSLEEMPEITAEETRSKPNYKYIPPQSDDSEDNSSVTYKPLLRLSVNSDVVSNPPTLPRAKPGAHPNSLPLNTSMPNLAMANTGSNRSSSVFSPSSLAETPGSTHNPIYDYLSPKVPPPPPTDLSSPVKDDDDDTDSENDSYVCLSPRIVSDKRTSPDGQDDSNAVLSDDVLHHQYEYLGPLPGEEDAESTSGKDFDSYVYMAPRDNSHLPLQNVYSSSPRNDLMSRMNSAPQFDSPRRLPLTQSASEGKRLERNLEHELVGSIKEAVEARLREMEKHYQEKLESISSSLPVPVPSSNESTATGSSRPNSWVNNLQPLAEQRSDEDESDPEENPLSFVADSNRCRGNGDAGEGEEGKVKETLEKYKTEMMEYVMKQAEKQMEAMEKQYQRKLQELATKSGETASPRRLPKRSSETFV